jgi:hypothetical protein
MIGVLGVKNAEKIVPIEDDMTPVDPVSENMAVLTGKPTKAFIAQDHDAHIAVHTSMLKDPVVMGQLGQTPQAQAIQAALMTHVYEHVAFQYRSKLQAQLGATLPAPNTKLPPMVEAQLSQLVAQAATQLLTVNQGQVAQQQAQQQMQDPSIQIQMKEVGIKEKEAMTRAKKVDADIAIAQGELALKQQAQQGKAAPPTETPEMIAQRHQQEMAQTQQAHQQQLGQTSQQQQLAAAAQQQRLAQAQQAHAQKMAHGGQVHQQKLTHAERTTAAKIAAAEKMAAAAPKKASE